MDVHLEGTCKGRNFLLVDKYKFHKKSVLKSGVVKWVCDRNKDRKFKCTAICYTEGKLVNIILGFYFLVPFVYLFESNIYYFIIVFILL